MREREVDMVSETTLIDDMTTPTPEVVAAVRQLDGPVLLLGASGKMGPTLAELLVRAGAQQVLGVARFADAAKRRYLEDIGVQTIACDLLADGALKALPDAPNVFLLAGFKFGATGNEDATWAMNTALPSAVLARYARSRIVYVSSGNVYAYTEAPGPGASEGGQLGPVGEYAQSRLGGERVAEYAARTRGTALLIVRLFYATEPRYGIIRDLADKVWQQEPIDLTMGYVNQIWQGDANAYLCRFFPLCRSPADIINLTGPETLSVRALAEQLGDIMGKTPRFTGAEAPDALLGNSQRLCAEFGRPRTGAKQMLRAVAEWVMAGGPTLGKPTRYESRSGQF